MQQRAESLFQQLLMLLSGGHRQLSFWIGQRVISQKIAWTRPVFPHLIQHLLAPTRTHLSGTLLKKVSFGACLFCLYYHNTEGHICAIPCACMVNALIGPGFCALVSICCYYYW